MTNANVRTLDAVTKVIDQAVVATRISDRLTANPVIMEICISVCHLIDRETTTKNNAWLMVKKIKIAVSLFLRQTRLLVLTAMR
jgi:hypothetical protein